MKILTIKPVEFPCKLRDCPPGFFLFDGESLGFASEYGDYFNEAGENFWGGVSTKAERDEIEVIPCAPVWDDR